MDINTYQIALNSILDSTKYYSLRLKSNFEEVIPPIKKELLESIVGEFLRLKHYDPEKFDSLKEKVEYLGYNLIVVNKENSTDVEEMKDHLCRNFKTELFMEFSILSKEESLFKMAQSLYHLSVNLYGRTNFQKIYETFSFILKNNIKE